MEYVCGFEGQGLWVRVVPEHGPYFQLLGFVLHPHLQKGKLLLPGSGKEFGSSFSHISFSGLCRPLAGVIDAHHQE